MFTLPDLPYGYDALQPTMSSETLHLHHDKHHARYFAVTNDILKDRLYTLGRTHPLRRSSQTAIHHLFRTLVRILAPIIPFTTDEAWSYATARAEFSNDSVHLQDWPTAPDEWTNPEIETDVAALLQTRTQVNETIEPLRASGRIGKSLDAAVALAGAAADPAFRILEKHRDFLPELFIVSHVSLGPGSAPTAASARPCSEIGLVRCPRCWRWVPGLERAELGEVCPRCAEALQNQA